MRAVNAISLHVYNAVLCLADVALKLIGAVYTRRDSFGKFVKGQRMTLAWIEREMEKTERRQVLWIHAASMGEYGVARPIIKQLKQQSNYDIVVTFFSPTGYGALRRHHPYVDHVFYLPLDTRGNVRRFLDAVRPEKAVFIISEYWLNYLYELRERHIPTYLISALISKDSTFFRWYGWLYKASLSTFTHIMVLDEQSSSNLRALGHNNLSVTGNPLFDNAIAIASTQWDNPIIKRFAEQGDVFIAGSVSDSKDMHLISFLANNHREVRFIIVPHEISWHILHKIKNKLDGNALCYSECNEHTDFSGVQALIIDYMGELAYMYRYAKWAYVGGGFTPYLHSIIEATVYGLPVAFGPRIQRKVTPGDLIRLGIGKVVRSDVEMDVWFCRLKYDMLELDCVKTVALDYSARNSGATSEISKRLLER